MIKFLHKQFAIALLLAFLQAGLSFVIEEHDCCHHHDQHEKSDCALCAISFESAEPVTVYLPFECVQFDDCVFWTQDFSYEFALSHSSSPRAPPLA